GLHRRQARRTCSDHGHVSSHTLQYGNRTVGYGQVDLQARTRLSRQAWVDAALEAIAEGGLASVAVVPLAERLGATKGSFYWHFPNRQALVEAALAAWEQTTTTGVIAEVEGASQDPSRQTRLLFTRVTELAAPDRGGAGLMRLRAARAARSPDRAPSARARPPPTDRLHRHPVSASRLRSRRRQAPRTPRLQRLSRPRPTRPRHTPAPATYPSG